MRVCVCVCVCPSVCLCVSVVSVDPVIKCYGPEGWPDIKALNDAIYYVLCVGVCVCVGYFIAFLPHVFGGRGGVSTPLVVEIDRLLSRSQNLGVYR